MSRSTANYIAYDLRPAKQIERRILLDVLKGGGEAGLRLSSYSYLGFGGFKFYDFEMLFRHLGIRDMTSIEQDGDLIARCNFNKPFACIRIEKALFGDFLTDVDLKKPTIAWLDYDWGLSSDVVSDVLALGAKIPTGSFVFVTVRADLPGGLAKLSIDERVAALQDELGDFSLVRDRSDLEPSNFPEYAERVMTAVLSNSLSKRSDGQFLLLARLLYHDSALMLTVGGCLCPNEKVARLFNSFMKKNFSFLSSTNGPPYLIPAFNLTSRERYFLDTLATSKGRQKRRREYLRSMGIRASTVDDYKRIIRFIPRYFETYI